MSYKNLCYNCFVLGLFVVFVIDDMGFMSGEIWEVIQYSIDIVNVVN